MAKSRNRSRDIRKKAAKKRKNRLYQERKLMELAQKQSEENDGTRQQDS